MRKNVIYGCVNLWGTSMFFLPGTCDAVRGLQCPKETNKRCRKSLYIFQTHEDARGPQVINFLVIHTGK